MFKRAVFKRAWLPSDRESGYRVDRRCGGRDVALRSLDWRAHAAQCGLDWPAHAAQCGLDRPVG